MFSWVKCGGNDYLCTIIKAVKKSWKIIGHEISGVGVSVGI
ncbi:MAG: hypothetical protein ACI8WB_002592 [Phenylobacterium sp.]|jgi:hypothetical protein